MNAQNAAFHALVIFALAFVISMLVAAMIKGLHLLVRRLAGQSKP